MQIYIYIPVRVEHPDVREVVQGRKHLSGAEIVAVEHRHAVGKVPAVIVFAVNAASAVA